MDFFKKIINFLFDFFKPDIETLLYIAGDPDTDEKTLSKYSTIPDWGVRRAVAGNPGTSPETLHAMRYDKDEFVIREIASNPKTDDKTLSYLASYPCNHIQWLVCRNEKTPAEVLTSIASKNRVWQINSDVTTAIAENPKTDAKTLEELLERGIWDTDCAIALNPNASKETLEKILGSKGWCARRIAREELERREMEEKQGDK